MIIFMIIFILLGLAAGINVMLKTAKEIGKDKALSGESLEKKGNNFGK